MEQNKSQGRSSSELPDALFARPVLPVALLDTEMRVERVSQGLAEMFAATPAQIEQTCWMDWVAPQDRAAVEQNLSALLSGNITSQIFECRYLAKSGDLHCCSTVSFPIDVEGHPITELVLVILNATGKMQLAEEYKELERQFLVAQKMESLGLLVGGVAHDFNNFLEVILGFATLARLRVSPESDLYEPLQMIEEAARRASELTSQLLDLIREEGSLAEGANLNEVLQKVAKIIRRTFDRKIQIKTRWEPNLPWVRGDARRLEQAILNLAINARDAMAEGGTLTLETSRGNPAMDKTRGLSPAQPVEYVRITVQDTGVGMGPAVLKRIFDPLFTTKPPGEGTGLGLTMARKMVQDCGGTLEVESEPGRGSLFVLNLPVIPSPRPAAEPVHSAPLSKGRGTVLVVEDEPMVLTFVEKGLRQLGYTVVTATSGEQACEIYARDAERIDCVLLDMIMAGMSGLQTYARLKATRPEVKVILSSGYGRERFKGELADADFLGKPYSLEALSRAIGKIRRK